MSAWEDPEDVYALGYPERATQVTPRPSPELMPKSTVVFLAPPRRGKFSIVASVAALDAPEAETLGNRVHDMLRGREVLTGKVSVISPEHDWLTLMKQCVPMTQELPPAVLTMPDYPVRFTWMYTATEATWNAWMQTLADTKLWSEHGFTSNTRVLDLTRAHLRQTGAGSPLPVWGVDPPTLSPRVLRRS